MSISLKALYDKVNSFEASKSTWTKGSNTNGSWFKESSTGLLIQLGKINIPTDNTRTVTLPTSFASTAYSVSVNSEQSSNYTEWTNGHVIYNLNKSSFVISGRTEGCNRVWIAIGYLITNSIRSLLGGGLGWL